VFYIHHSLWFTIVFKRFIWAVRHYKGTVVYTLSVRLTACFDGNDDINFKIKGPDVSFKDDNKFILQCLI